MILFALSVNSTRATDIRGGTASKGRRLCSVRMLTTRQLIGANYPSRAPAYSLEPVPDGLSGRSSQSQERSHLLCHALDRGRIKAAAINESWHDAGFATPSL
jgi:hypothetical protein